MPLDNEHFLHDKYLKSKLPLMPRRCGADWGVVQTGVWCRLGCGADWGVAMATWMETEDLLGSGQ